MRAAFYIGTTLLCLGGITGAFAAEAPVVNAFQQPGIYQQQRARATEPRQSTRPTVINRNAIKRTPATAVQQNAIRSMFKAPPRQEFVDDSGNSRNYTDQSSTGAAGSAIEKMNRLQQELRQLRGALAEQNHTLQLLQKRQQRLLQALKSSDTSASATSVDVKASTAALLNATPSKAKTQQQKKASTSHHTVVGGSTIQQDQRYLQQQLIYKAAINDVKTKNYSLAITDFKLFLKKYPHGRYAADAHYWLGELYLLTGHVAKALTNYQMLVQHFPHSNKTASATYKIGLIYFDQNRFKKAKQAWQYVLKHYRDTVQAKLSQRCLQKLRAAGY